MTLYFEKKLQFPPSAQLGNRIYSDTIWHSVHPLLAISAFDDKKGGIVSVYDHLKEDTIDIDSNPKQDVQITSIAWHPTVKYLAIGYETGEVVIWNHDEFEIFEGAKSHHGPITLVRWSSCGLVLISTDTLGSLVVWASNAQGHLQTKAHHDFNDPVVQLIARPFKGKDSGQKENVENIERSLGKMTSWRPKTAAKRATTASSGPKSGSSNKSSARRQEEDIYDVEDEDPDPNPMELNQNSGSVAPGSADGATNGPSATATFSDRCFFVGLLSGAIFYLKDNGTCDEVLTSGSSIKHLLFQESRDVLIVMTEASIMGQFKVDGGGGLNELSKVKLSGLGDIRISWVGPSTIAVLSKELSVRLWNLDTGENSVLEADPTMSYTSDEVFSSVDFQVNTGILSCSTNKGKIIMWREIPLDLEKLSLKPTTTTTDEDESNNWEWYNSSTTTSLSSTKELQWCQTIPGTLAINGVRDVFILTEHELVAVHKDKISVIQTQQSQATVSFLSSALLQGNDELPTDKNVEGIKNTQLLVTFLIQTDIQIKNFAVSATTLAIWSGQEVEVYEVSPELKDFHKLIGSFKDKCSVLCLFEQSAFILESEHVQIRTFQGTLKQTLTFMSSEGFPILITAAGEYITVGTANGYIKVWHVGQREAKSHSVSPNLVDALTDFGEIIHAKNNYDGSKVAFTVAQKTNLTPDSRFFIWDLAHETITTIAFPGHFITQLFWELEINTFLAVELKALSEEISAQNVSNGSGPKSKLIFGNDEIGKEDVDLDDEVLDERDVWNISSEPGQEKSRTEQGQGDSDFGLGFEPQKATHHQFATLFYTPEKGILIHSRINRDVEALLLGLEVPHLIVLEGHNSSRNSGRDLKDTGSLRPKNANDASKVARIVKQVIEDFDELDDEDCNLNSKTALTKSVYFDLIGDNDQALKVLRPICTKSIWVKMAKRCVTTKRLDIASACLAHVKDARGALAVLRIQEEEPDQLDVHLARLALHLRMNVEAMELYKKAGRYDLLLEIYKAGSEWDAAIAVCEKHLRIQLRTTFFEYAKFLEEADELDEAIEMYEKSDTFRTEVPRLLVEKDVDKLEKYILAKKDKELYKWWAQFLESGSDVDNALHYYELADDWLSLVRLLCFSGQVEQAILIAEKVDDKASAYHLARAFEDGRDPHRAIHFYTKAQAFGSGIRLCKEYQLDDQLWNLAVHSEPMEQADAAKYFETQDEPDYDRAIKLYHKSGYGAKALDLAFSTQEYGALQSIVQDLLQHEDQNTDPELLKKCAEFFIANKEYERALETLTAAKKYVQAMEMCVEYNLPISEDMAERLTAPKGAGVDEGTRLNLLLKMGECCMSQGNYHLAAKKFTQGGDKVQAMKSLLKSGDTERIIFYANVCRHREIYMMAAHYLQTIDLKNSPQTVDVIIQFYNRAKAPESIIAFYESCAQSSSEDVDYVKSLQHLKSAESINRELLQGNNLEPSSGEARNLQNRLQVVQAKIGYVQKFLTVQTMLESKNNEVSELIQELLEDPNVEMSVRKGDIYVLLVETFTSLGDYQKAIDVIDEMKSVLLHNPVKYFKGDTLQVLQNAVGSQFSLRNSGNASKRGSTKNQPPFLGYERSQSRENDVDDEEPEDDDDVELLNNQIGPEEEDTEEELDHDEESEVGEEDGENQLRMMSKFGLSSNRFN